MKLIKQYSPFINKQEINYISKVLSKKFLTENLETKKFEKNFSKIFYMNNVVAMSNWTLGLLTILKVIGIQKGDEVIVPNLTFFATATPILICGAKIVLCDISINNFSLDLNKLKKKITKKTKCIIPVHLFGFCCNMWEIRKICKKKKIFLIEDSAQALGAKYKNLYLGSFGDFSGFSFYGNKIITTGEGAMVISKKKYYLKKLFAFKNHGRHRKGIFKHKVFGLNFMFTEMQAAIGNIQLKKFKQIIQKKIFINKLYKKLLSNIVEFPHPINGNEPNYWMTCIFVKNKIKLKKFLLKNKIETRDFFYPLNLQPAFKFNKLIKNKNEVFKNSMFVYRNSLILPSGHDLTNKKIFYITSKIKKFYNEIRS